MEIVGVDPKIMADYVATANNPKYNGDYTIINSKFPELKGYDPQLLADYVATANNPKYNGDYATINSKFPELFEDNSTPATTGQKKNISTPTQGQVPTTQPVQQSKPTNNMGGGSNTTANTRTDNQVIREQLQDQFDFAVFDVVEKSKYNDPNKWSASKTFGTPSQKKKEYEETQARIAEGKTVNIPARTEADKQKEVEKLQSEGFVADEKTGGMVDAKEVEVETESNVNLVTSRDVVGITTGQENPYYLGSTKAAEYDAAQFQYEQSKKASKEFQAQTGLSDLDFLEWTAYSDKQLQDFLTNNPNATPEQLDYFYDNTWQKFDMTKKKDLSGSDDYWEGVANRSDYIVNGIMSNTLMGRGATFLYSVFEYAGLDQTTARLEGNTQVSKSVGELYREKQQAYGRNMSRYKNMTQLGGTLEGAIYLGIDMPLFEVGGSASAGTTNTLWNFGKNILKGTPKSVVLNTAANIAKEGIIMGGTLGTYDAMLKGSELLSTKSPDELEAEDYKEVVASFGKGMGTGIIVGSVMGIGNRILSRANSKALATTYSPDPTTGMVRINPSTGVAVKALNYAGQTALFGTEAIVFSASHELFEEGTLSNYTTEEMWQGIVSFIPIKAMGVNKLIESVKGVRVNPDFLKDQAKGKNWMDRVEFNSVEMGLLGIKDVSELKNYSEKQNESWYNAALKNEKIPEATKRKLAYGMQGLEIAKTFNVTDRVIKEIDGKPAVVSYDKNGKLADISVFNSKVEANREVLQTQDVIENNKLTEKTTNLAPESVDNINMFYEKNPDRLVALNDAISKVSNKRSLAEKDAVKEFNDLIDKELKTQEQNPVNKMAEDIKIEPPKEEAKPVEAKEETITLNDKEYTVRENEVFVKNEQGLLTRETNNDIIKQVKEQYDTQNKSGLPSEVREGQKPIETEPIKETSGEKIEAGRDVQTPEKEVKDTTLAMDMPTEKVESISSERLVFDSLEQLSKMKKSIFQKGKKVGERETKTRIKDYVNSVRKVHSEVAKYLTQAENKSILAQIEGMTTGTDASVSKATNKISTIINDAHARLMDAEIKTMDKTVEKIFDTERIDRERAQKEAKTTTEYIDFTKQVKDKAVQEPEKIQERLEELYDVIASSSNKIEVEAAKSEIEALLYAQDISVLNQLKNEFYDANSSYTDKLIAFNEMNDAYSKFMSKDPIGTYKKAYKERMATLEAERKIIQETNDIFKKSGLNPAELSKREKLAETYEKIVNSEATREVYLQEAIKDVDSIPNLSDKQKRRIKNKIESKLLKNKKAKNNDAQTDADAISEIYNLEVPIKPEYIKNKSSLNVIQKGTIQFENLKGLLEILGGKNREVLDKGRELNEMADKAALKFDKLSRQQGRDLGKLERLIESDNDIRQYIGEENLKLGVKEPIMSVEKLDKDGNIIEKSKAVADFDKMSYSQIMYLNQLLKTKSNVDILSKEYAPESIDALQKHCKDIVNNNPKLKEISDYIFNDLQGSIYKINNEQYKKENGGVELDKFEDYVARYAIRNETRGTKSDKKGSLKPSATRIRKGARSIKSKVNIVQAITEAYTDAVKYNAFSDVNMYWNRTLRNESVKTAIKTQVANGTTLVKALEKMYEAYPEGQRLDDIKLAKFIQNVVVSKLAFNVSLAPKQAIGAFNVYVDYAKSLGEKGVNPMLAEAMFAKNMISPKGWTEFARAMQESDPIKQRFHENGIDPSIANYISNGVIDTAIRIGKGKNYAPSANYLKFQKAIRGAKEVQMLPVKLGDFAALVGTKPLFDLYYNEAIKTMSPKEARIEAMDKAYSAFARSNQSVWSHNMSPFQLSSTGKFFAYYTSPIQMGQQFRSAARTLINESSTKRERVDAVRGIAYYGAIQTAIFGIAGAASNGLIKWMLKQAGQAMGYNTDPEDSWSDLEKFFNLPEEKKDMIGKIMQNQGVTVGVPIVDEITKMMGGRIAEDPYYKQDLVTTLAAIYDIAEMSATVIGAASEKGEYKNWSPSEKKKLWKLAFTSVDGATGFGTGTLQRYGRFVLGLDILDAAEKDSTKTDSKITTDGTKTTDSKIALPDTKPLK